MQVEICPTPGAPHSYQPIIEKDQIFRCFATAIFYRFTGVNLGCGGQDDLEGMTQQYLTDALKERSDPTFVMDELTRAVDYYAANLGDPDPEPPSHKFKVDKTQDEKPLDILKSMVKLCNELKDTRVMLLFGQKDASSFLYSVCDTVPAQNGSDVRCYMQAPSQLVVDERSGAFETTDLFQIGVMKIFTKSVRDVHPVLTTPGPVIAPLAYRLADVALRHMNPIMLRSTLSNTALPEMTALPVKPGIRGAVLSDFGKVLQHELIDSSATQLPFLANGSTLFSEDGTPLLSFDNGRIVAPVETKEEPLALASMSTMRLFPAHQLALCLSDDASILKELSRYDIDTTPRSFYEFDGERRIPATEHLRSFFETASDDIRLVTENTALQFDTRNKNRSKRRIRIKGSGFVVEPYVTRCRQSKYPVFCEYPETQMRETNLHKVAQYITM